ncbi:hypothetical protein ACYA4W_001713, partial [Campylobacter upsaliensis]
MENSLFNQKDIAEIKQLDNQNKKVIMSREKHYVNHETGEIVGTEVLSLQVKTKDEFVKIFVENMDYLGKTLEGFEFKTLFFVLKKIDYQNSLIIDSTFRKNLSILFGNKSPSVIARAIKGLIEKQILIEINTPELRERFQSFVGNAYYVNPNIIGKGSFRDIKKLRQTTIVDYDFEQNQVKKRVNVDTEYKEAQDVLENSADYQIDNVELIENEKDKIKGTNLIISKKDESDGIKEMEHKPDIAIALAQIELEEAQLKLKKATLLQQNSEIAQV